jgi:hypothetical protein
MVAVPSHICEVCGEYLPHACAPIVTVIRGKFERKTVTITDR